MSKNDGAATTLRRRLLKVIAPITLSIVVLTAITVIGGARLLIFPIYADTVSLLIENLAINLDHAEGSVVRMEEILSASTGERKLSYLVGSPESLSFQDKSIKAPKLLMSEAVAGLGDGQKSVVRISGYGPSLRLLGVTRLGGDQFLVVAEDWRSFGGLYLKVFGSGLILVLLGVAAAVTGCLWLIFAPIWSRLRGLENALRKYGQGRRDLRLPLDEKAAGDGFLLVHFEFNRMADTIVALAAEKEQRAAAERAWLAGLAHDLYTPMTIMRGHAENLVEHGHYPVANEEQQRLSEILAQSLYMQALVDDLLTQASARLTTLKIDPEWVELSELYDVLIDTFYYPTTAKGVVLVADDQGLKVWTDPLRLRQILVNLIRNALTHAGNLNCIELLAERADGGTWVIVQDDGDGLEAGVEETIFTSGRRGERVKVKGWGLGLTVVKMLAEAHRGYCRVGSGAEGGVRFEIWLPEASTSKE